MKVDLAYGAGILPVEVPDTSWIVRTTDRPGLADPQADVVAALRQPRTGKSLPQLIDGSGKKVTVVFPDITRPMPNRVVLPPLLAELERQGAGPDSVTLLCSTGTHRPATPAELEDLLGPDIVSTYRVRQHIATGDDHVRVGSVDGVDVWLDEAYVAADVRIVTGFVEPHFFAGFSGGPKAVCPGVASLETILEAHSPARILDPGSTWMELDDNPVHSFIRRATDLLPPDMSLDVTINSLREVTAVFAGSLPGAHRQACDDVRQHAETLLPQACDVVVASNSGLPLDRNLYQAVKGMAAAERIVRPGGDIVMVSSCIDGFPDDGPFGQMLVGATSVAALTDPHTAAGQDTWQTQVLGRVLSKATVHFFTNGLTDDQVRSAHLEPTADPSATVARITARYGKRAVVGVLPEGPLTVATIA